MVDLMSVARRGCVFLAVIASVGSVAEAAAEQVVVRRHAFAPDDLTVAPGSAVTWLFQDPDPHNVRSSPFSGAELIDSPIFVSGSFTHTFRTPGSYSYICAIHPTMRGAVTVSGTAPPPPPPPPPPVPSPAVDPDPPSPTVIRDPPLTPPPTPVPPSSAAATRESATVLDPAVSPASSEGQAPVLSRLRLVGRSLRFDVGSAIAVDVVVVSGAARRALISRGGAGVRSVGLRTLPAGRYRVTLSTRGGNPPVSLSRMVTVPKRPAGAQRVWQ